MSNLLILGERELVKAAVETALSEYSPGNIAVLEEECREKHILGAPVLGGYACAKSLKETHDRAAVAIANNALRLHWMNRLEAMGYAIAILIHPRCTVSAYATVGEGSCVHLGAMVNAGTSIGRGCMVCSGCVLAQDCLLRDGVNMCCGAHAENGCEIGYRARIGAGAVIGAGVRIGDDAVVCPGSVVEKNVDAAMIVMGAPACVIGNAVFDMNR